MAARRALPAMVLAANLLLSMFWVIGEADVARGSGFDPDLDTTSCPNGGVAVPGEGRVLVRWVLTSARPVGGEFPLFEVQRSGNGGGTWAPVATTTRAQDLAEAEARLGPDAQLVLDVAEAARADPDEPAPPPFALMEAIAFLESEPGEGEEGYNGTLALHALADASWRAAWALGSGVLDEHKLEAGETYRYRVLRHPPGGGAAETVAETQVVLYQDAPQAIAYFVPPDVPEEQYPAVRASSIEEFPTEGPNQEWGRQQRYRSVNTSILVAWDMPLAATCVEGAPPERFEWPAGYHVYRRPQGCDPQDCPPERVSDGPVRPNDPQPEYANGTAADPLDSDGQDLHAGVRAYFKDTAANGLVAGQGYCYSVRPINLLGDEGLASGEDCAVALDTHPPPPPVRFNATLDDNRVVLTWFDPGYDPEDPDAPVPDHGVARYEVWRTRTVRQDLLPADSQERWQHFATVQEDPGSPANRYPGPEDPPLPDTDQDCSWYAVRAVDDADPFPLHVTRSDGTAFLGNPSAFSRPMSRCPLDITPPQVCLPSTVPGGPGGPTRGDPGIPGGDGSRGGSGREPGRDPSGGRDPGKGRCTTKTLIDGVMKVPLGDPAKQGCLELDAPADPAWRKVLWFQGSDASPDHLHLARVFPNHGQLAFCNPLDLHLPAKLCVRLQGEDRTGNRGPLEPAAPEEGEAHPCYYPQFSAKDPPPPPFPVILSVEDANGPPVTKAKVTWDFPATSPNMLFFQVWQHATVNPPRDPYNCPDLDYAADEHHTSVDVDIALRSAVRPFVPQGVDPDDLLLTYFVVSALQDLPDHEAGVDRFRRVCSDSFAYNPNNPLADAFHPVGPSPFGACTAASWTPHLGGVNITWGTPAFDTSGQSSSLHCKADGVFVVYRSPHPDRGFVAITPPLTSNHYVDVDAPDSRFYYQVAMVGNGTLPAALFPEATHHSGEVRAASKVLHSPFAVPQRATHPSDACSMAQEQPIERVHFGVDDASVTLHLCHYQEVGDAKGGQAAEPQPEPEIGPGVIKLPPLPPVPPPPVPDVDLGVVKKVTITGEGLLELDMPGVGQRLYRFDFQDLSVLAYPGGDANVLGGEVTHEDALPGRFPLPAGDEAPGMFRYQVDTLVLDLNGARGTVSLVASDDLRFRLAHPAIPLGAPADALPLPGEGPLTADLDFGAKVVPVEPASLCSGGSGLALGVEPTGLPLVLAVGEDLRVTREEVRLADPDATAPLQLAACAVYEDKYHPGKPGSGIPQRRAPASWQDADGNDRFLKPVDADSVWTGTASLLPSGLQAELAHHGSLRWVTGAPMGFRIDVPGAQAAVSIADGRIAGGSIEGAADVRMAYQTTPTGWDPARPATGTPELREVRVAFADGLVILDGGAMRATAGQMDFASLEVLPDMAVLPWHHGAFAMPWILFTDGHVLEHWELAIAPVRTFGTVALGQFSDDDLGRKDGELVLRTGTDLLGPDAALHDLDPGTKGRWMGLTHTYPDQRFVWRCVGSAAEPVHLHADVNLYLRQSGVTQHVQAKIDGFVDITVRGYDAKLLRLGLVFLDSALHRSDIGLRFDLPYPAAIDNLQVANVQLDEFGCVTTGRVLNDQALAEAWNLPLAPEAVAFREDPDDPPHAPEQDHPGCDPGEEGNPQHCRADYPHHVFWILGAAGLPPHVQDPHPLPALASVAFDACAACTPIPLETAWAPSGQTLGTNATRPVLRVDRLNWTTTDVVLGKGPSQPGAEDHQQPGADWAGGNLGDAPCDGGPQGTCPPFLRVVGHLALPYWAQDEDKSRLTMFQPGVVVPCEGPCGAGLFGLPEFLGFQEPLDMVRGWTEASGMPDVEGVLYYLQPVEAVAEELGLGDYAVGGMLMGINLDVPYSAEGASKDILGMDVATMVSTLDLLDLPGLEGEPSFEMIQGMAGSQGLTQAANALLDLDATAEGYVDLAKDKLKQIARDKAGQVLGEFPDEYLDAAKELQETWNQVKDIECKDEASCYKAAKVVVDVAVQKLKEQALLENPDLPPELKGPVGKLANAASDPKALLDDFELDFGQVRARIVWADQEHGDYRWEAIIATIRFDDTGGGSFSGEANITATIQRDGVVFVEGKPIRLGSRVNGVAPETIEFYARLEVNLEAVRFDGGVSVQEMTMGTTTLDFVEGVFGAGQALKKDSNVLVRILYFGIAGEGHDDSTGVALGMSLLVGTLDDTALDLIGQLQGFEEVVEYLRAGDAPPEVVRGAYVRAYGEFLIWSTGFDVVAGVEIGLWMFEQLEDNKPVEPNRVFNFGFKNRAIVTVKIAILHIRGDMALTLAGVLTLGNGSFSISNVIIAGSGYIAGGLGFCSPASWDDWDSRFWDDDWCVICGAGFKFQYSAEKKAAKASGSLACGLG